MMVGDIPCYVGQANTLVTGVSIIMSANTINNESSLPTIMIIAKLGFQAIFFFLFINCILSHL